MKDYLDDLSEFACLTLWDALPIEVKDRTKWIVADSLAVIAVGMQAPEMKKLVRAHITAQSHGNSWIIGTGLKASVADAGMLNGCAGTWVELDEGSTLAKGHPGIQILPIVLAYAQDSAVSGRDVIRAIAIGYEVSARINYAAQIRPIVHPHGTFGVIGAAVALGVLKSFDVAAMRCLINVAATMGLATSYETLNDGATVRNIYTGHSAHMGLLAVRLVECGFTGERDGVASIYGKVLSEHFDTEKAIAELGSKWLLAQNYFKLHPTARSLHSAIDALEDALKKLPEQRLQFELIANITVRTYRLAAAKNNQFVVNSFGAKFSIPFALASILYHGHSSLDCFDDVAVANPGIQRVARLVTVSEELAYSERYPAEQCCDVEIDLTDGTRLSGHCRVMKGEPEFPNTLEQIHEKFVALGRKVWSRSTLEHLWAGCLALDQLDNASDLFGATEQLSDDMTDLRSTRNKH